MEIHAEFNPPSYLNEVARAEWERVRAARPGRYVAADRELLALYCQTHARLLEVNAALDAHGLTMTDPEGALVARPEADLLPTLVEQQLALCEALGLTPAPWTERTAEERPRRASPMHLLPQNGRDC